MEIEKRSNYIHLPDSEDFYRAYVMTCEGPLNLHIQIHDWSEMMKKRYESARHYRYSYITEECPGQILTGTIFICHLKGVELAKDSYSTREAGIWMKKQINKSVGWFLVRLSDIDVYKRILVTLYYPNTVLDLRGINNQKVSINNKLLEYRSKTGTPIAFEYMRPQRERINFSPSPGKIPVYYFCDLYRKKEENSNDKH